MKFRTKNQLRNLLLGSLVLAASAPALALKSDSSQPVSIDSLKQSLDMQSNVSTFTDNVVIKQGTIDIRADKVVVTRPGGDQNKTYIEAFGNPVTFYQMQDSGKPVKGHAQESALRRGDPAGDPDGQRLSGAARQQRERRSHHLSGATAANAGVQR